MKTPPIRALDPREANALVTAHSAALMALFATHPMPDSLRREFARLAEAMHATLEDDPFVYGLYRAMIETLEKAIPREP